jgi:hypothetical protein
MELLAATLFKGTCPMEWRRNKLPLTCNEARTIPWRAATAGNSKAAAKQAFLSQSDFLANTQAATRT